MIRGYLCILENIEKIILIFGKIETYYRNKEQKMKKIILILLLINSAFILSAETSGKAGFQMLKLSYGADAAALAGTGAFHTNNAYGFLQNPTASVYKQQEIISISQNLWIFDTSLYCGAYSKSNGKKSISYSYRYLDYGKLEYRDDTGLLNGEYHPLDLVLSANYGYRFTPDNYAGITLNGLYEKIADSSNFGYTLDFGYTRRLPLKGTMFSATIKNLGQTSKMNKKTTQIPISTEIGINHKFYTDSFDILSETKFTKNFDNNELQAAVGLKMLFYKIFSLKVGNKFNYDAEDLTVGFGIEMQKISFNYAFIPLKYEIEDAHIFELSYKFR